MQALMKLSLKKVSVFALSALLFTSLQANAQNPEAKNEIEPQTELVLKSISERYEKLRSWRAKFSSTNTSVALGTSRLSNGEFIFDFPNRFRFSLNGPSEISDFVSNGTEGWYARYPKGRKSPALVQHFKDVSKLELDKYLILLKGLPTVNAQSKAELLRTFKLSSNVNEKHIELILEPRRSDNLTRVKLVFDQNKEYPEAAQLEDALGGETLIKIIEAQKANKVKAEEFAPKFPKGSQIEEF